MSQPWNQNNLWNHVHCLSSSIVPSILLLWWFGAKIINTVEWAEWKCQKMAAGPPFIPAHCGVESLINEIQKTFTKIITRSNISVHYRYCLFMFIALGHIWFWHVNFIWQPKSALVGTNCCKLTLILKTLEIFCLLERWKWWWWFVVALLEGNVPCLINISMWSTRMSCMYV